MKQFLNLLQFIGSLFILVVVCFVFTTLLAINGVSYYFSLFLFVIFVFPYLLPDDNKETDKLFYQCILSLIIFIVSILLINSYLSSLVIEYSGDLEKYKESVKIIGIIISSVIPVLIWLNALTKSINIYKEQKSIVK